MVSPEIAAELFLGPLTVRTHVRRAKTELGVRDRARPVAHADRSGLAPPPRRRALSRPVV
ncbi:hypothetical protein [Streptomyces sp. NPDC060275]|uniref:hypothetical protein n=1 Tax=Streptomyces sp. NPDC060275 TaxID=3347090 RepID=UPI003653F8B5